MPLIRLVAIIRSWLVRVVATSDGAQNIRNESAMSWRHESPDSLESASTYVRTGNRRCLPAPGLPRLLTCSSQPGVQAKRANQRPPTNPVH
eukprot:scaffold121885_cov46-Prasinocladus_malaysianus.AAC.1